MNQEGCSDSLSPVKRRSRVVACLEVRPESGRLLMYHDFICIVYSRLVIPLNGCIACTMTYISPITCSYGHSSGHVPVVRSQIGVPAVTL